MAALRSLSKNWLPVLLNAYLATPAVQRMQLQQAIGAYACCCEPATVAQFFRSAVTKLIKVLDSTHAGRCLQSTYGQLRAALIFSVNHASAGHRAGSNWGAGS